MKIKLYQIDIERDSNIVCYMCYESTLKRAGKVDPEIYNKVFEGEVACRDLEDVYHLFNVGQKPENYFGRSMSVSDVLCVVSSDSVAPGYYFCDSIGFKEITFPRNQKCRFRENGKCDFGDGAAECAKEKKDGGTDA